MQTSKQAKELGRIKIPSKTMDMFDHLSEYLEDARSSFPPSVHAKPSHQSGYFLSSGDLSLSRIV